MPRDLRWFWPDSRISARLTGHGPGRIQDLGIGNTDEGCRAFYSGRLESNAAGSRVWYSPQAGPLASTKPRFALSTA